jgi:hypothetical protein
MACMDRHPLNSIIVSDERGMILGTGGLVEETDEALAAVAPLLCRAKERLERKALLETLGEEIPRHIRRDLSVRRFSADGESLYLCARGERGPKKDEAMKSAIRGLKRILR